VNASLHTGAKVLRKLSEKVTFPVGTKIFGHGVDGHGPDIGQDGHVPLRGEPGVVHHKLMYGQFNSPPSEGLHDFFMLDQNAQRVIEHIFLWVPVGNFFF
tara:strand:+ start:143065 stop:143364 length:300 start_codon:yes stop_codon:yes gene_type:complete